MVHAFMVKYKFKINGDYSHSDYGYQKLFRAIYGYVQVVTKSSGKKYIYHRPGVLTLYPYIKKGKNEVILNKEGFSTLTNFLKTGKNPAHRWNEKGNWNASYTMYDIDISSDQITKSIENLINNTYVLLPNGESKKILDVLDLIYSGEIIDNSFLKIYSDIIKKIKSQEWYNQVTKTDKIKKFEELSRNIL